MPASQDPDQPDHMPQAQHVRLGDIVAGDKVRGDKVAGDKIIYVTQPASPPPVDPATLPPPVDLPDLFPPAPRLIGQRAQLDQLTALLGRVARARRGRCAFVTGRPGHGKRVLAYTLAELARAQGAAVVQARFWPTARLGPDDQDALWRDDPQLDRAAAALEPQLAQRWPAAARIGGPDWVRVLAQVARLLDDLPAPTNPRDDDPQALKRSLRAVARQRPLVLVLEGLDHAPDQWIDLLRDLAAEIERDLPILLIATLDAPRPLEDVPDERRTEAMHLALTLQRAGRADLLWLGPVAVEDVVAMIGTSERILSRRLHDLASGVPAIIASLWAAWQRDGVVAQDDDGVWLLADDSRGWVGGDLRDLPLALLDARLDADAPFDRSLVDAILGCAALEGPTFTAQALARVLGLEPAALLDFLDDYLLDTEERPGLLAEVGFVAIPDADYARYPNLYRFAAPYLWHLWARYGLADAQRADHQRRLADALESVYSPATNLISAPLIALFEATGQPTRAEPYRRRLNMSADIVVLRWQITRLEQMAADDFDRFRLFELRLALSDILFDVAQYAEGYAQAEAARQMAVQWQHPIREARALNLAGLNLHALGDLVGVRPLYERALFIHEQVLKPDHPDTATSLNNLGALLREQGDLAGARPYLEHARGIWERVLGLDHPKTALSLNNLGGLLREQGDLAGAKSLYERALVIQERVLGPEHPDIANSLNNLGGLFQARGDLAGARSLYERALVIQERVLGLEHPDMANSLNNLGDLLRVQGYLAQARPYLERALAIRERMLGSDHTNTATSLHSLGLLLQAQGDLTGARSLYERALVIRERVLGPNHPNTASSLNNLGLLLQAQGDLAGARPYLERALAIWELVLGIEHPDTALSLNNLGSLLQDIGDLVGAKSLYERALVIREQVLGTDHLATATSLNNLSMLLWEQGDLAQSREYLGRALAIVTRALGPEHPTTHIFRRNLAALDAPPQTGDA